MSLIIQSLDTLSKMFRGKTGQRGYITGLVPTNNSGDATNDIDFSEGIARDSEDNDNIHASAMTKKADATWAPGTGNGGMAAGVSFGANTFHLFVLGSSKGQSDHDFGFDTSLTAANLMADAAVVAAGLDIFRRVESFITTGAAWISMEVNEITGGGLRCYYNATPTDLSSYNGATTRQTLALTIPSDVQFLAIVTLYFDFVTNDMLAWVRSVNYTDSGATSSNNDGNATAESEFTVNEISVLTDTFATIAHRQSSTNSNLNIRTKGYIDYRLG